ncbi:MAG TPA: hypothetical protein VK787_14195 [Puia sp.]|jgi:hypothetical protein|nr:hypothetical protein [Puia sp.]
MKNNDKVVIRAVALCFKPYLKPEEAMVYCNLGRTQLAKRCDEFGIYKNNSGYFKRADLDLMMCGSVSPIEEKLKQMKFDFAKKSRALK